jgi:hypothetical protein
MKPFSQQRLSENNKNLIDIFGAQRVEEADYDQARAKTIQSVAALLIDVCTDARSVQGIFGRRSRKIESETHNFDIHVNPASPIFKDMSDTERALLRVNYLRPVEIRKRKDGLAWRRYQYAESLIFEDEGGPVQIVGARARAKRSGGVDPVIVQKAATQTELLWIQQAVINAEVQAACQTGDLHALLKGTSNPDMAPVREELYVKHILEQPMTSLAAKH